jgi:single-strand DNA-binding protein
MASFNKVMLIGRVTRDPELRYTPQGSAVCDLRVVSSRQYRTPNGERREEVCYLDVVTWRRQAEVCAQYLKKGKEIFVEGRLTYDEWEKKLEDGSVERRTKLRVTAERVQFLGSPPGRATTAPVEEGADAAPEEPAPDMAAPVEGAGAEEDVGF